MKMDLDKYPLMKGIPFFENNLIFLERGFDEIYAAIKEGKPFYVVTGIRVSSRNHIGYSFLSKSIEQLTERGGKAYIFIPETEDEYSLKTKGCLDVRLSHFYNDLIKDTKIIPDSQLIHVFENILKNLKGQSVKRVLRTFGMTEADSFGIMVSQVYSASSHFFPNFSNRTDLPTLVLGLPAHKSAVSFSREYAKMNRSRPPSAILFKPMPGKDGSDKMSESKPSSCIYMGDETKFLTSVTGGQPSREDQIRLGGNPNKCTALKIANYFASRSIIAEREVNCREGELCSKCKEYLLTNINK